MAYSDHARALRACQVRTKHGDPCANFAAWDDPLRRCGAHGGRVLAGLHQTHQARQTHAPPCTCVAWPFPHRPGALPCQWPDLPVHQVRMPLSATVRTRTDRADKRALRGFTRRPMALLWHYLDQSDQPPPARPPRQRPRRHGH